MSYIVIGSAALSIGGKLFGGFSAASKKNKANIQAAKTAAGDIYEEQLGLLGEQRNVALTESEMQIGTQIGGVKEQERTAISQSGLATSGSITAKAKSDMQKLFDTRSISKAKADLSYRSGEMSAEEAYQDTLTQLEGEPDNFLEGMYG
jgi:hypothetical protein